MTGTRALTRRAVRAAELCAAPFAALFILLLIAGQAAAQVPAAAADTVRAGRFDAGRMWTFEYPPVEYFTETYGFQADTGWFRRARLGALRIPGCSAAFVSPEGLVLTNHHCVRGAVNGLSRPGENLLDNGFVARTQAEERRMPSGFWADQLIAVQDVSAEVFAAIDAAPNDEARRAARESVTRGIIQRLRREYAGAGDSIHVEVVSLYHGGRYSAYVFRRYTDVRLVAAAELALANFGGDYDNFTYPRHSLDFAFLRVYGRDGRPLRNENWFRWSLEGVKEGDVVFVIGNPGPTNRLTTVAQLEFQREVEVPARRAFLESRLAAMQAFYAADRETGEAMRLRPQILSISNSLKAYQGRETAVRNEAIMARRRAAERDFRAAIEARPELRESYGDVIDRMAAVQARKRELAAPFVAFTFLEHRTAYSTTLRRAFFTALYLNARSQGASGDALERLRQQVLAVPQYPRGLDERYLAARFADFRAAYGPDHPLTVAALGGREPAAAAAALLDASVMDDSAAVAAALDGETLASDPAVRIGAAMLPEYTRFQRALAPLLAEEAEIASRIGRARFEVYGTNVPPDATSSPRISDGVVLRYPFNGTFAPPYTTFYGVYDLYHSHGPGTDWDLTARWLPRPAQLDLDTPLNFVSTADTFGGNSGSPAVTPELKIVGVNFDRNFQALSRDYIYLPEQGRNVMVDVRAILEAMRDVYGGGRIVEEVTAAAR